MAGLDAVDLQVGAPEQPVAIHLANMVEGKLFLFIQRILFRHVADQRLANQRHIARRAVLPFCIQPVHRHKVGVFQPERLNVVVHQADKGVLAAGDIVRQRDAGVIA